MTQTLSVRERPILFSGPMVRAIIAGTKTQTRRVVKGPTPDIARAIDHNPGMTLTLDSQGFGGLQKRDAAGVFSIPLPRCPYGAPGGRLWVRETFQICSNYHADCRDTEPPFSDGRPTLRVEDPLYPYWEQCYYAASDGCPELLDVDTDSVRAVWRPSIFMPRWASRLTLEVTDVRVERLQDISEDDARAEGVDWAAPQFYGRDFGDDDREDPREVGYGVGSFACDNFTRLWDVLNAKRAPWGSNPWVWVVSFRRVEASA